jgi:hypothetical protein
MREVKERVGAIEHALNGRTGLHEIQVQEFCYLQLRLLCELIALGCLVAHGHIKETRKIKDQWSANIIISMLETYILISTRGRLSSI